MTIVMISELLAASLVIWLALYRMGQLSRPKDFTDAQWKEYRRREHIAGLS